MEENVSDDSDVSYSDDEPLSLQLPQSHILRKPKFNRCLAPYKLGRILSKHIILEVFSFVNIRKSIIRILSKSSCSMRKLLINNYSLVRLRTFEKKKKGKHSEISPSVLFLSEAALRSMVDLRCYSYWDERPILAYMKHYPNPKLKIDKFEFSPNDCHELSYYDKEGVSDFFKWLAKTNIRLLVQNQKYTRYKLAQLIEIKNYCHSIRKIIFTLAFNEKDLRLFFQDTIEKDLVRKLYGFIKEEGHLYTDEEYIEVFQACNNHCLVLDEVSVDLTPNTFASFLSRVRPLEKLTVHLIGLIDLEEMKHACRIISILKQPPFSLFKRKLKVIISKTQLEVLEEFAKLDIENKQLVEEGSTNGSRHLSTRFNLNSVSDAKYVEYAKICKGTPLHWIHPIFGFDFVKIEAFPNLLRYLRLIHKPIVEVNLEYIDKVDAKQYDYCFYVPLQIWSTLNKLATHLKLSGSLGYVVPFIRRALKMMPNLRSLEVNVIKNKCISTQSDQICKEEEDAIILQFQYFEYLLEQRKGLIYLKVDVHEDTNHVNQNSYYDYDLLEQFVDICLLHSKQSLTNLHLKNIKSTHILIEKLINSTVLQHLYLSNSTVYFQLNNIERQAIISQLSNSIASFTNLKTFNSGITILRAPLDRLLSRMLISLSNLVKISFEKVEYILNLTDHYLFLDELAKNNTLREISSFHTRQRFHYKHIKAIIERKPAGCKLAITFQYLTLKEYVLLQRVTNYKYIVQVEIGTFSGEEGKEIDEEPYPDLSKCSNEEEKLERLKHFWEVDETFREQYNFSKPSDAEYEEAMIEHVKGITQAKIEQITQH
ncbi:hypothetical protein FGO68_gene1827 [Halteria grandinella]|uniref:Uncharacterized protein n=1 Tax=Halteria grandinella TaxID=5974 RepID=A0A8J8T6B2_HALGN|nr:hypothetical protein FGO68_gene1827 [Halteria grandinella]